MLMWYEFCFYKCCLKIMKTEYFKSAPLMLTFTFNILGKA